MVQTTKPSFSSRSNAKRAAEKMIVDGKAPAVDYAIRPCHDGRFEIIWKATRAAPTTEEVAAEFTAATETATSGSAPEMGAEPAVTSDSEPAAADTTRTESESAEAENLFPAGTWVTVRKGKHKAIVGQVTQRIGSNTWRVHEFGKPESWTQLATAVQLSCAEEPAPEAPKPARRSRRSTTITPAKPSRSQYAINADMIAAGKVPEKPPVVTSKANPYYQKRFDTLHGYAAAGDWDAVRDYKVTGSNSYSKMVARYRQDLLALHACPMSGREPQLTIRIGCLGARSGAKIRHGLLTCRMIKEICNATSELAGFPAPFFSVLPDLFIAGNEPHETNSPASGLATGVAGRAGKRLIGSSSRKAAR